MSSEENSFSEENKLGLKKINQNIFRLMRMHKGKFIFTGICAIIAILCTVINPILLGDAINVLIEGSAKLISNSGTIDFPRLYYLLTIITTLYFLSNLFSYLQAYYLNRVTTDIIYTLRERMIKKVLELPMGSVDENQRGNLLSRFTNDIDILQEALSSSFLYLTSTIIKIIFTLILMVAINVWMTLAIIIVVLFSSTIIAILLKLSQRHFDKQILIQGTTTGQIEEIFSSHEVIRSLNYEKHAIKEFNENADEWSKHELKSKFLSSLNTPVMSLNSNLGYVLVAILGGIFVLQGSMSVGRILTFLEYLKNFTDPIEEITEIFPQIQAGISACDRIFTFLEYEEEENPSDKELESFDDEIRFENISFGYTEDKKIIDDFNLTVKKGEKIAIIGETGAGKTTLIKLLMRLYDINSGEIKIDGVNINEYDKHSLRSFMGMVLQESWLFSDTIKENIRYGNLDANDDKVIDASRQANTDHFIRQLPDGYKTILNEDGDNLSQGQKQLLTIARAIISEKEILILDEATSNIDTRTELLIQESMDKLMENKTSFIIAHRLSTIRNADKIIVLGKGRVIEQGTHEELLAKKGYYYNTLNSQANNY